MAGLKAVGDIAELITETRRVFERIGSLETSLKNIVATIDTMDKRLREVEATVREVKFEAKYEAVKEAQGIVNSVQSAIYQKITELSVELDRTSRQMPRDTQILLTAPPSTDGKDGDGRRPD